ncbi:Guanylate-binding protein 1 [Halotydeus destructor]|nr:Guanylate-binding protein 1 [Halotydeus destructor]
MLVVTTGSNLVVAKSGDEATDPVTRVKVPDQPIQLVKPDADHRKLVLVEENIRFLHQIKAPLAIVAVVGKFHSGKSFLMNQLMGKGTGFGVGPSVQPMTMGIWMWGKPAKMKTADGEEISVIFLDTEGFAANNVSENYDAKVFAVATLLSSHLLYNSVKIIDQVDIDYLELLSRRTQLFALKSQMSKAKWIADFNEDLLTFPPLTWIVQDFFQDVLDGESPRDWLHRLMSSHVRENEGYEISILDIFKNVDCHTLFLPATKKVLLNDLSKATESDLTEEYVQERDELIGKLKKQLKAKSKRNKNISGVEVAHLLHVLTTAANEGSLADVPSRWESFVERLQLTATEDCLKFYDDEMHAFIYELHGNQAIKLSTFEDWHVVTLTKSTELMKHLLQGLDDTLRTGLNQLKHRIDLAHERTMDLNEKKIRLRISQIKDSGSIDAEEQFGKLKFPVATSVFMRHVRVFKSRIQEEARIELEKLLEQNETSTQLAAVEKLVDLIADSYQLRNNKAIEAVFENSINESIEKFRLVANTDWDKSMPQRPHVLDKIIQQAELEATGLFSSKVVEFKHEAQYLSSESLLKEQLGKSAAKVKQENSDIAGRYMKQVALRLSEQFALNTGSDRIPLPAFGDALDRGLKAEVDRTLRTFDDEVGEFAEYEPYALAQVSLKTKIADVCDMRRKENLDAFTKVVKKPLEMAKKMIILSHDRYTTVFRYRQFIRKLCLINLDDGQPKAWPVDLKIEIIDNFVNNDEELTEIMSKKQGLWSSVVGFFEWLFWFFGFIE